MKRHSALSNEIWLLRRLVKYEKRFPLLLSALIAMKLLLPLLSTLLPAAAVAALTRGGGMGRYLAVIGGLMALYAGAAFLRPFEPCAAHPIFLPAPVGILVVEQRPALRAEQLPA